MTRKDADPDLKGDAEKARSLAEIERLAWLLDSHWRIPGTRIRFGVDALAGLLPGIGDAATGLVSAYIILRAARNGASLPLIARMSDNVLLDTVIGSVPLAGTVFDVFFKANNANIALLKKHLERRES